jgi:hypothetical protein
MISYFWSTLLKIDGFIKIFITPIVKVISKSKKISKSFFFLDKYNK